MTQLSAHFSLAELTKSAKYPDNIPNEAELRALEALCQNVLEKVRTHFGVPVTVNSGFRNARVNKLVGGAATSQHLKGEAADIEVAGIPNAEVWHFIVSAESGIRYDQCIAELLSEVNPSAGWVHVSFRADGKNRSQALSFLGKGKYVTGLKYAS